MWSVVILRKLWVSLSEVLKEGILIDNSALLKSSKLEFDIYESFAVDEIKLVCGAHNQFRRFWA